MDSIFDLVCAGVASLSVASLLLLVWRGVSHIQRARGRSQQRLPPYTAGDAAIARQITQHEDQLHDHRVMWLLTGQGVLFAALAFIESADNVALERKPVVALLALIGVVVATSAGVAMDAGDAAVGKLASREGLGTEMDVIGHRSPPLLGLLLPWRHFPVLFVICWGVVSVLPHKKEGNRSGGAVQMRWDAGEPPRTGRLTGVL